MSDIAATPSAPTAQTVEPLTPIPADPPVFSTPKSVSGNVTAFTPVSPAPDPSPSGVAGLDQYVGDLGQSVASFIPAKLRGVLYPLGYVASAVVVILGQQHIIDLNSAILVAGAVYAFSVGLSTSNVPKSGK